MEKVSVFVPTAGDASKPLLCGTLIRDELRNYRFSYDSSFLTSKNGFELSPHAFSRSEKTSWQEQPPYVLSDAESSAWGQKVLACAGVDPSSLIFKFYPTCNRTGAISFRDMHAEALPTNLRNDLSACLELSHKIETGDSNQADAQKLAPVTAGVGGARPKALVELNTGRHLIAKFPSPTDLWPIVQTEFLGMQLARLASLDTADVELIDIDGEDVLLVERFDIESARDGSLRRHMFSALTALQLADFEARYASYPDFADFLMRYSHAPAEDCRELYRRMVFNMMVGNTDDHARNHSVFWDGSKCRLSPAYDIVVFPRVGLTSSQAMIVGNQGTAADAVNSLSKCSQFGLTRTEARGIHIELADLIADNWRLVADEAGIPAPLQEKLGRNVITPHRLLVD